MLESLWLHKLPASAVWPQRRPSLRAVSVRCRLLNIQQAGDLSAKRRVARTNDTLLSTLTTRVVATAHTVRPRQLPQNVAR